MKNTILMGMSESGKTTLIQALMGQALLYNKTQVVTRHVQFIDTPGEYIERRYLYHALITTAADAEVIGLIQDVGRDTSWIPPAFSATFNKPVFGVVTKTDLAHKPEDIERARQVLADSGADPIFEVSAVENSGLEALWVYLNPDGSAHPESVAGETNVTIPVCPQPSEAVAP